MNLGDFFGLDREIQRAVIIALLVLLALSLLGGVGGTLWYRAEAASARSESAQLAADLAVERANVAGCKAALGRQNEAVAAFKDQADRRVAEAEKHAQEARRLADAAARTAAGILAEKPVDPADLCGSAMALYRARGLK